MVSIGDGAAAPPPPSDATALDFDLPQELIQDAVGRILCVVCKVYVPRGQMNATQHLGGKRHAAQAQRVPPSARAERRAELVEQYARERAAAGQPPLAGLSVGSGAEGSRALEKRGMATSSNQQSKLGRRAEAGDEMSDAGAQGAAAKRVQRVDLMKSLSIDRAGFLASILDSDCESVADSSSSERESAIPEIAVAPGDANLGTGHDVLNTQPEVTDTVEGRSVAFAPVKYTAPEGASDAFFASMPEETAPSDRPQVIRELLAAKSRDSAAPSDSRVTPRDTDGDDVPFLALQRPSLGEEENMEVDDRANTKSGENGSVGRNGEKAGGTPKQGADSDIEDSANALPPWLVGDDAIEAVQFNPDSSIALHYEILEFERFMSATNEEEATRRELVQTVTAIVQAIWPTCRVEVFGSYATDLFLPTSDIDICVLDTPEGGGSAPNFSEYLELAQAIRNVKNFARRVNFIKAKVPLVKIVSRNSNVQCDISFNRGNGPANVPVIKKYLEEFPALRPLLMVLKCFLQQRSLNEVFSGGLGSYSLLLLVVSHLQMSQFNFPGSKANLGSSLHQFFQLYGRVFNYCVAGIRVKDNGSYFDKSEKYHTTPAETMRYCVEDPNDETNELGRSSFASSRIRKAFGNASMFLSNWRRDDTSAPVTPLSSILHIEDQLRERRARVVEDYTNRNTVQLFDAMKVKRENNNREMERRKAETVQGSRNGTPRSALENVQADYRGLASSHRGFSGPGEPNSKRRRGESHREYDGGMHPPRGSRHGGRHNGMGPPADMSGGAMYGQHMAQVMQGGDHYPNSYDVGGMPGMGGGGGPMYNSMGHGMGQMNVDPYSGFAPDPMQLAQMQGMQYGPGQGGMGQWNGGGMGAQHQAYDPRFAQVGMGNDFSQGPPVPGQTWRHAQQNMQGPRGGMSRPRGPRSGRGGRGSGRGRGRRGR